MSTACNVFSEQEAGLKNHAVPVGPGPAQESASESASTSGGTLARRPMGSAPTHRFHPYAGKNSTSSPTSKPSKALPSSPRKKSSPVIEEAYTWTNTPWSTPVILGDDHAARRMATAAAWKTLLPKLVYPFMQWQEAKTTGGNSEGVTGRCSGCFNNLLQAKVNIISFMSMYNIVSIK
jgi:hypothetical protein